MITNTKRGIRQTTATATAPSARIGDVDADSAAFEICVVHRGDGGMGLRLSAISYETKTTRALRLAVTHNDRLFDKKVDRKAKKNASLVNQEKTVHAGTKRRTSTIVPKLPKAYQQAPRKKIRGNTRIRNKTGRARTSDELGGGCHRW
jgi:hypothetical protein